MSDELTEELIESEARLRYVGDPDDECPRVAWLDTTDGVRQLHRDAVAAYVRRVVGRCRAALASSEAQPQGER